MADRVLKVKDKVSLIDKHNSTASIPSQESHGLWAKTKIMGSYDDVMYDKNGIPFFGKKIPTGKNKLGETIFRTERTKPIFSEENMVTLGGCQYAMEKLFGVKNDYIDVPTMYSKHGIGYEDSTPPSGDGYTYTTPDGAKNTIYRYGHFVQLFGVGITGTAENDITVHPVDYRENDIDISKVTTDGLTLEGKMVPFRYTAEDLSSIDRRKYFGKKSDETGVISYYLKRFENPPSIKHIWKTGDDYEAEIMVSSQEIWEDTVHHNAVESFTDVVLKITKKDVKEWFTYLEQEDRSRINTIALFTGEYVDPPAGSTSDVGDYRDVRLFSKLNIPTEYLVLNKDLNIIYRVYTS